MTKTERYTKLSIVIVADDLRQDSMDGHGLDMSNYEDNDLLEIMSDCVGFRINDAELRLAKVAFEEGAEAAKRSIWF